MLRSSSILSRNMEPSKVSSRFSRVGICHLFLVTLQPDAAGLPARTL